MTTSNPAGSAEQAGRLTGLDVLYENWMAAEAYEQAAAVMLGVRDDIEMLSEYEIAVERVEESRGRYEAALMAAEAKRARPSPVS